MEDTRETLLRQRKTVGNDLDITKSAVESEAESVASPVPKILFLDIDGVLNSAEMLQRIPGCFDRFDRDSWVHMLDVDPCARLERVLVTTGAKIVLSSTWRVMQSAHSMTVLLRRQGVASADVIDVTPPFARVNDCNRRLGRCAVQAPDKFGAISTHGERGHEIQKWLSAHPEITTFAIVDDNSDMAHLRDRLVLTSWATGMLDEHADALIEMLGEMAR